MNMNESVKKTAMGVAAVAALALGGSAIAGAATNGSTAATGPAASPNGATAPTGAPKGTPPNMASHTAINPNEKLLTGDTASKVEAAATAKVKGTVDRVETDDGGVYEAHITKADGSHVAVKVDKQFNVTSVDNMNGPPAGGQGGPPPSGQGGPPAGGQGGY